MRNPARWLGFGLLALLFVASSFAARSAHAQIFYWDPVSGGNGHYYEYVAGLTDYPTARAAAGTRSHLGIAGHLATITSAAENTIITGLATPDGLTTGWIGLEQPDFAFEPGGNFEWITGEPLFYTEWSDLEPNDDSGTEEVGEFYEFGQWNDNTPSRLLDGYYIEYDPNPVAYTKVDVHLDLTPDAFLAADVLIGDEPLGLNLQEQGLGYFDVRLWIDNTGTLVGLNVIDSHAELANDVVGNVDLDVLGSFDFDLHDAAASIVDPASTVILVAADGTFSIESLLAQFTAGALDYVPHGPLANLIPPGTINLPEDYGLLALNKFAPLPLGHIELLPTATPGLYDVVFDLQAVARQLINADLPGVFAELTLNLEATGQVIAVPEPSSLMLGIMGIVALAAVRWWPGRAAALFLGVLCTLTTQARAQYSYWAPSVGGNGHVYQYVPDSISWTDAAAAAAGSSYLGTPGHLATITSLGENAAVSTAGEGNVNYFHGWIGLSQAPGSVEPAEGFEWVTGEPLVYTNWGGGEPNNSGDEHNVTMQSPGTWNDLRETNTPDGYFVEYETISVHAADLELSTFGTSTLSVQILVGGEPLQAPFAEELVGTMTARVLYTPGATPTPVGVSIFQSRADIADVAGTVDLDVLGSVDFELLDAAAAVSLPGAADGLFLPVANDGTTVIDDLFFQYQDGTFNYVPEGPVENLISPGSLSLVDDFIDFRIGRFSPGLLMTTQILPTPEIGVYQVVMQIPISYQDEVFPDTDFVGISVEAFIEARGTFRVVPEPSSLALAGVGALGLALIARRRGAKRRSGLPAAFVALGIVGAVQPARAQYAYWSPEVGGNGHIYQSVQRAVNWFDARDDALGRSFLGADGHLLTLGSAAENEYARQLGSATFGFYHMWIGLFQPPGSPEPDGDFQWHNGEPVVYTNWRPDAPNDNPVDEDATTMEYNGLWNDLRYNYGAGGPTGYLVEYDPQIPIYAAPLHIELAPTSTVELQFLVGSDPIGSPIIEQLNGELDLDLLYTAGPMPIGVSLKRVEATMADVIGTLDLDVLGTVDYELLGAAAEITLPGVEWGAFLPLAPDGTGVIDDLVFGFTDGLLNYEPHGPVSSLVDPGSLDLGTDTISARIGDFNPGLTLFTEIFPTPDPLVWGLNLQVPVSFTSTVLPDSDVIQVRITTLVEGQGFFRIVPEPSSIVLAVVGALVLTLMGLRRRQTAR